MIQKTKKKSHIQHLTIWLNTVMMGIWARVCIIIIIIGYVWVP